MLRVSYVMVVLRVSYVIMRYILVCLCMTTTMLGYDYIIRQHVTPRRRCMRVVYDCT
jgi:hypothetical protein